jgi:protein involved in temperature-dependent protein secretion
LDDPNTIVDKITSKVVDKVTKAKISEAEATIRSLPVDAATQHYLLTQLYSQHSMWPSAIEQLTTLIEMQPVPSANL